MYTKYGDTRVSENMNMEKYLYSVENRTLLNEEEYRYDSDYAPGYDIMNGYYEAHADRDDWN